jgi:hypothetical protein
VSTIQKIKKKVESIDLATHTGDDNRERFLAKRRKFYASKNTPRTDIKQHPASKDHYVICLDIDLSPEAIKASEGKPGPLDEDWRSYLDQSKAYKEMMRSYRLTEQDQKNISIERCFHLIKQLDCLKLDLLPKRDQLAIRFKQAETALMINEFILGMFYLSQAEVLCEIPAGDFLYAQVGYVQVLANRNGDYYLQEDGITQSNIYQTIAELCLRNGDTWAARDTLMRGERLLLNYGMALDNNSWYSIMNIVDTEENAEKLRQYVIEYIRRNPGVKQTDLYISLSHLENRNTLSSICYYLEKGGEITRTRSGRSYALTFVHGPTDKAR